MSEMDRLEAIEAAVQDVAKVSRGKRTTRINKKLAIKLTDDQLKESWARELMHRRALFITALREEKVWP